MTGDLSVCYNPFGKPYQSNELQPFNLLGRYRQLSTWIEHLPNVYRRDTPLIVRLFNAESNAHIPNALSELRLVKSLLLPEYDDEVRSSPQSP